jgi:hypothetical protein
MILPGKIFFKDSCCGFPLVKERLMGFLDWVQKKSSDKCRDNLTRGIPMFVEVCKRMNACEERKLSPSQADIKEAGRLRDMLWLNAIGGPLPPDEVIKILNTWVSRPNEIGAYAHTALNKLYEAAQAEIRR